MYSVGVVNGGIAPCTCVAHVQSYLQTYILGTMYHHIYHLPPPSLHHPRLIQTYPKEHHDDKQGKKDLRGHGSVAQIRLVALANMPEGLDKVGQEDLMQLLSSVGSLRRLESDILLTRLAHVTRNY